MNSCSGTTAGTARRPPPTRRLLRPPPARRWSPRSTTRLIRRVAGSSSPPSPRPSSRVRWTSATDPVRPPPGGRPCRRSPSPISFVERASATGESGASSPSSPPWTGHATPSGWFLAADLWRSSPWAFDPRAVAKRRFTDLADVLRSSGVSQRHGPDAVAWRLITEALTDYDTAASVIRKAVDAGSGDARQILDALSSTTPAGTSRFPMLAGPKVGPMWVRMLAVPGRANVSSLELLPVAVDVQVRRVTEKLGVTDTAGVDLEACRSRIQRCGRPASSRGRWWDPRPSRAPLLHWTRRCGSGASGDARSVSAPAEEFPSAQHAGLASSERRTALRRQPDRRVTQPWTRPARSSTRTPAGWWWDEPTDRPVPAQPLQRYFSARRPSGECRWPMRLESPR